MESAHTVPRKNKRKRKWKPVSLDSLDFFQGDKEGFVSLEVLEGDDLIEYEAGGKIMKASEEDSECVIMVTNA